MHPQYDDAVVPDTPPAVASASAATVAASDTHERKRKQLFECLNTAELGLKGTILEQSQDRRSSRIRVHDRLGSSDSREGGQPDDAVVAIRERRFRGEESIFKKPPPGIMKCLKPRKTPDYQVNPHKWKKYSLSDADTSDRTNTSAAFEFLREIEERKRQEDGADEEMNDEPNDGKIVFKQRRRGGAGGTTSSSGSSTATFNQSAHLRADVERGEATENADRAVLKGSKVVMPEYVIGQKQVAANKAARKAAGGRAERGGASAKNQLKLGHLFDEEEEED